MKDNLTDKEIKAELAKLKELYPNNEEITISYYGSGDSFEGYDVQLDGEFDEKIRDYVEDIFWTLVERVGSDFNNDGSRGDVTINLKEGIAHIQDYYYVTEAVEADSIEIK